MSLEEYLVDPYKPQAYAAEAPPEEEADESAVPISAVPDPWAANIGEEAGIDPQSGATSLGQDYRLDEYGVPQQVGPAAQYNRGPGMPHMTSRKKPPSWQSTAIRAGVTGAVTAAVGAYGAGGRGAVTVGVGEGGAGQYQQSSGGYGGQGGGPGMTNLMSAYAGYQAAPYGAAFEREYMGGYSPGYTGSGSATPLFQATGARTDREARQARGERIGMSGAGAIAGAMGGGGWGAVYGAGGAQFAENPHTGKRGYQEEYKYTFKPMVQGQYRDITKGPGTKGGYLRGQTNWRNMRSSAQAAIPGMAGLGGGGKKPPPKSQIKGDIAFHLAGQVTKDYQIQEWWNTIAEKGTLAGREYIKGGLTEEGREWATDENIPDWALGGVHGKGKHTYRYGPEEIGGKRVAGKQNVGMLAALQQRLEETGDRKAFWKSYMKDYNMWQEGGAGFTGKWHGKTMYQLPSEIYGKSPQEMWGDIDFDKDYTDIDWLMMNEEEGEA